MGNRHIQNNLGHTKTAQFFSPAMDEGYAVSGGGQHQLRSPFSGRAILLAAAPERPSPEVGDMVMERDYHCSEAAKLDRFWLESSAPIPRLEGAHDDEGIEVFRDADRVRVEAG
jgi:hypothetical protein